MFQLDQIIDSSEKLKAEIAKPPHGAQVVSDEHGVSITGSSVLPLNYLSPKSILEITGLLVDAVNKEASKRHKDDRSGWVFCDWIAGSHGGSSVIENAKRNSKYTFSNFIKVSMLICPDSKYKFMLHHFESVANHNKFVSTVIADKAKTNKQKSYAGSTTQKKYKGKKRDPELCDQMILEYLANPSYKQTVLIKEVIEITNYSESHVKSRIKVLKT